MSRLFHLGRGTTLECSSAKAGLEQTDLRPHLHGNIHLLGPILASLGLKELNLHPTNLEELSKHGFWNDLKPYTSTRLKEGPQESFTVCSKDQETVPMTNQ